MLLTDTDAATMQAQSKHCMSCTEVSVSGNPPGQQQAASGAALQALLIIASRVRQSAASAHADSDACKAKTVARLLDHEKPAHPQSCRRRAFRSPPHGTCAALREGCSPACVPRTPAHHITQSASAAEACHHQRAGMCSPDNTHLDSALRLLRQCPNPNDSPGPDR